MPPKACDSRMWRQFGSSETFTQEERRCDTPTRQKTRLIGISRPRRWQKQLLMNLLLSPQLAMDVRDEEPLCSSSATEAALNVTPTGKKAEINSLKFQKCFKKWSGNNGGSALAPFTASLALSLYFSFSSPKSFSLAFPHITRFPLALWPYIHWRFQNHHEAATSFFVFILLGLSALAGEKKTERRENSRTVNMPHTCLNEANISVTLQSLCSLIY